MHFESTADIAKPVGEVFAWFLAMDENAPRIDPEADTARKEPPGETRAGTVFYLKRGEHESPITFTAIEPDRWIDFATRIGPMRPTARLSFEPTTAGTRLTIRAKSNLPFLLKPVEPIANRMGKKEWDARLQRIRADLEGRV